MLSETDKAYLAGVVDGEGTITLAHYKGDDLVNLWFFISNTNIKTLKELQSLWGGSIGIELAREGCKPVGRLRFGPKRAGEILKLIQPFLRIKKEQCQVALQFRDTISNRHSGGGIPPIILNLRYQLREEMKLLNKRGLS